jgi:hypothetical protein
MTPAGSEGLHSGFLGGESRSEALYAVGLRIAVADLGFGKDSAQEAITEADDGRLDTWYFRYVNASADNHAVSLVGWAN